MHLSHFSVNFLVSNLGHGCNVEYFSFRPAIHSLVCHLLWLRNQIFERAFERHLDALLHLQMLVVTLLWRRCNCFSDDSSTCRLPYRDNTTKGSDRITMQAGRNRRIRIPEHPHANTSCQGAAKFPKGGVHYKQPDDTI